MQKKNSVIKNYILSPEKYFLKDETLSKSIGSSLYHLPLVQSTERVYLFLLRK